MFKLKENWQPVDGLILEESALNAVKLDTANCLVVAGPGSGKTELLAQRACYLLETNECIYPKKILAISFKRDAAKNLAERVKKRCGSELSNRFISKTYDSFAKNLLDHFRLAIPKEYRPTANYNIVFNNREFEDTYRTINEEYFNTTATEILNTSLIKSSLPLNRNSIQNEFSDDVWRFVSSKQKISYISFPMITRLAEYIINSNPKLKKYLQTTYSHVFLDEFQDTNLVQYDLVKSCFLNSNAIVTAVGDDKQTIMRWAGAVYNIFSIFKTDFSAKKEQLLMNHRSAPKLVELQKILVNDLMKQNIPVTASSKWEKDQGEIMVWVCDDYKVEAENLSQHIDDLLKMGLVPRDISILVKQRVANYASLLIEELRKHGINARNENDYQDLITEELILFILNTIYVASNQSAKEKQELLDFIFLIINSDDEAKKRKIEDEFHTFVVQLKKELPTKSIDKNVLIDLFGKIIEYLGINNISTVYQQYSDLKYYKQILENFAELFLKALLNTKSWSKAVIEIKGETSIPIMTTHKSKGLEYNTVIFVGLEDSAFWSFKNQQEEDKCLFFVAMSRAKERLLFTFSKIRNTGRNDSDVNQSISGIGILYKALQNSKLVIVKEIRKSP